MFSLFISSMALWFSLSALHKVKQLEDELRQKRKQLEDLEQNNRWNEQYIKKIDEKTYMMYDELRRKVNGTDTRSVKINNI